MVYSSEYKYICYELLLLTHLRLRHEIRIHILIAVAATFHIFYAIAYLNLLGK